jgi:drug/metabolite transporter (DMT)-like permease
MELLVLISLAAIFYTLFDIFASRAGNRIDANLSAAVINGLGAIIPLAVFIILKSIKGAKLINTTTSGIIYSLLAGLAIALFSLLFIKIFERSGLAYVMPLIYGTAIALASLTGWLIFKETVSALQIIGIIIVIIGIALIVVSKFQSPIL